MAFWLSFKEQAIKLWESWTLSQRTAFSAAALACIGAVLGTVVWASQPDYVVIASQLKPSESAEIVGLLDTDKIGYKLNFSGSAVSVASSDVATARLALKDVIDTEEDDDLDGAGSSPIPFMSDAGSIDDRRRAAMEKRVEKSLLQINGIQAATVSISRPEQSPFAVEQSPVTAAVVIQPAARTQISPQTAYTIISVVARSVPGLVNSNIILTDTSGRQIGSHEGISGDLGMQLEYRQRVEADLSHKAERLLATARGVHATVQVNAEIDFTKQTRVGTKIDPEQKATRTESIVSSQQDAGAAPPVGVPGAATNIPADANQKQSTGGKYKNEQIDAEYDYSSTSEEVTMIPGKILRLTVSAFVDLGNDVAPADPANPAAPVPTTTPLKLEDIETIVKNAVGFDETRDDAITVVEAKLNAEVLDDPVATGFRWEQWQPLLQSISLGLAATLAFLIGLMLMKRMKPIVITETVGPGIPLADARRLASISEQAKANPEIVANILSAWLSEQDREPATLTSTPAAPIPDANASARGTVTPGSALSQNNMGGNRKAA